MAVKHFFGGETSKVGGIEKIYFKNWLISVFQGKIYHFNHFFLKRLEIVTEIVILNADL